MIDDAGKDDIPTTITQANRLISDKPKHLLTTRGVILLLLVGCLVASSGGGFMWWSGAQLAAAKSTHHSAVITAHKKAADAATAQKLAAARAAAQKVIADQAAAKAAEDAAALAQGFIPGNAGVYYKSAQGTCGYLNCSFLTVVVSRDCLAGVYVAASLMAGSTSIGMTNGITAGLPAGGSAMLRLDFSVRPDSITVTDAHCMG